MLRIGVTSRSPTVQRNCTTKDEVCQTGLALYPQTKVWGFTAYNHKRGGLKRVMLPDGTMTLFCLPELQ